VGGLAGGDGYFVNRARLPGYNFFRSELRCGLTDRRVNDALHGRLSRAPRSCFRLLAEQAERLAIGVGDFWALGADPGDRRFCFEGSAVLLNC